MSTVTTIEKLAQHVGTNVTLRGWVHNKNSKGKLHFIQLRDGTGFVQCLVFKGAVGDEIFHALVIAAVALQYAVVAFFVLPLGS